MIIDPVTGMVIPQEWIDRSGDPQTIEKVTSGRWVLLSDGMMLRRGLTTGTTAAAVCKGAVLSLSRSVSEVEVPTPCGLRVILPVEAIRGQARAIKDGGDHAADATNGMPLEACAQRAENTEMIAGKGIGRIGRHGLNQPPGKPAISPWVREQIMKAIREGLDDIGIPGARVELSVPEGEEIARRTLNPKVGVVGGISILGSTGFVEPWNEHLEEDAAFKVASSPRVVVTTGRAGLRFSRMLFPQHQVVLMGSKLDLLRPRHGQDMVLCGLPGLIFRWAWPEMLEGTNYANVAEMMEREPEAPALREALVRVQDKLPGVRVVIINRRGEIIMEAGP